MGRPWTTFGTIFGWILVYFWFRGVQNWGQVWGRILGQLWGPSLGRIWNPFGAAWLILGPAPAGEASMVAIEGADSKSKIPQIVFQIGFFFDFGA